MHNGCTTKGTQSKRASCNCECSGTSTGGCRATASLQMRSIRRRLNDTYVLDERPGSCEQVTPRPSLVCYACLGPTKSRCPHRLRAPARLFCGSFSTTCGRNADYPMRRLRVTRPL